MHSNVEPSLIQPGAGIVTLSFGKPQFKIGRAQGSAGLGLIDTLVPPGAGFRLPHWHDELEEAFYVLDGELEYLLGDVWAAANCGTTIFIPAGCVHAWRNNSGHLARHLVLGDSPDMLELIRELGNSPEKKWDEICARHHTHLAHDHPQFPRSCGAFVATHGRLPRSGLAMFSLSLSLSPPPRSGPCRPCSQAYIIS